MVDLFNGTKVIVPLNKSVNSDYLDNIVNYIKALVNVEPSVVVRKHTLGWVLSIDLIDIFLTKEESIAVDTFFQGCCHIESNYSSNYMKLFTPSDLDI